MLHSSDEEGELLDEVKAEAVESGFAKALAAKDELVDTESTGSCFTKVKAEAVESSFATKTNTNADEEDACDEDEDDFVNEYFLQHIEQLQEELATSKKAKEVSDKQLAGNTELVYQLQEELATSKKAKEVSDELVKQLQEELAASKKAKEVSDELVYQLRGELDASENAKEVSDKRLAGTAETVQGLEKEVDTLQKEVTLLENKVNDFENADVQGEKVALSLEVEMLEQDKEDLSSELKTANRANAELEDQVWGLELKDADSILKLKSLGKSLQGVKAAIEKESTCRVCDCEHEQLWIASACGHTVFCDDCMDTDTSICYDCFKPTRLDGPARVVDVNVKTALDDVFAQYDSIAGTSDGNQSSGEDVEMSQA